MERRDFASEQQHMIWNADGNENARGRTLDTLCQGLILSVWSTGTYCWACLQMGALLVKNGPHDLALPTLTSEYGEEEKELVT